MKGYAIVHGRKIGFELSKGLAAAHRRNAGQSLSAAEAIANVEEHRRVRAIKHASPYVEARRVLSPGRFVNSPAAASLLCRL